MSHSRSRPASTLIALRVNDNMVRIRYPCLMIEREDGAEVLVAPIVSGVEEMNDALFVAMNLKMWGALFTDCNIFTFTATKPSHAAHGFKPERVNTFRIIEACATFYEAPIVNRVFYSTRARVSKAYFATPEVAPLRVSLFGIMKQAFISAEIKYANRLTYISHVPMIGELYDVSKSKTKSRRGR